MKIEILDGKLFPKWVDGDWANWDLLQQSPELGTLIEEAQSKLAKEGSKGGKSKGGKSKDGKPGAGKGEGDR